MSVPLKVQGRVRRKAEMKAGQVISSGYLWDLLDESRRYLGQSKREA